jgi:CBS domain-containing protein
MPGSRKKSAPASKKRKAAAQKNTPQPEEPEFSGICAADIMVRDVLTVSPDATVEVISSLFQLHNINGCPVVDEEGLLIGIVTEDDLVFGRMGVSDAMMEEARVVGKKPVPGNDSNQYVSEIMTPNPITAEEDTPIEELCRLMWRLKIHRIPIVREGSVSGIVSSLDVCRIIAEGSASLLTQSR